MKTYILSFTTFFLAAISLSEVVVAGNEIVGFEKKCTTSAAIVWATGAGSTDANIVFKLHGDGGYYSDNRCNNFPGDGHRVLKINGQWRLIDPNNTILYISDLDSELPPSKGWRVSGGVSPAPTFGGNVTNAEIPEATNLTISGTIKIGETLTASYDYSHPDDLTESGSIYKWYSASDTTANKTLISGANEISYKLKASEMGKYIQFVVKPDDGTSEGDSVASAWVGLVTSITTDKNALAFDGIDDRITIPDDAAFNFINGFSAQAWINPSETKEQVILAQNNGTDSGNAFLIKMTSSGAISVSLTTTNSHTSSYYNYSLLSSESINVGEWSHIAVRSDNNTLKIFINGSEKGSKDIRYSYTVMMPGICPPGPMGYPMSCPPTHMPGFAPSVVNNVSISIEIGSGNNTQFFKGAIDEVSIWGKALSASEISNGMNYKRFGNESGLIVYYDFNQGLSYSDNSAIIMIEDASDNGIDGTLNNFSSSGVSSNFVLGAQQGTFTDKYLQVAPIAENVNISGTLQQNQILSGEYDYSDVNDDYESGSTFKWYSAFDSTGSKTLISGETGTTFTLRSSEIGKYIQFVVTPNDGSSEGDAVASAWAGPVTQLPPKVVSILRQNPTEENTKEAEVTFRITFDSPVTQVDTTDFITTGTVGASFKSVSHISDSLYDISLTNIENMDGTLGLAIKGVGDETGENNIVGFSSSENKTIEYLGTGDYLTQAKIGQTFTATETRALSKITIYPKAGNHSFNGTATLTIYHGDEENDNNPTQLSTQTVTITSDTQMDGQTFSISGTPELTQGETYSFVFTDFSGSGYAFNNSTNSGYTNGHVIFTGMNSSHESTFDLAFTVYQDGLKLLADLSGVAPNTIQSYTIESNNSPNISSVATSGNYTVGESLEIIYTFTDSDGDEESGSVFKWYVADDANGSNEVFIDGATEKSFAPTEDFQGKYIRFQVTPSDGNAEGETFTSSWMRVSAVDEVPLTIESITRFQPTDSITNIDYVVFIAKFDSAVKNVDADDFTLSGTTASLNIIPVLDSGYESHRLVAFSKNESELLSIENDITAYQNLAITKRDDFKSYAATSEDQYAEIISDLSSLRSELTTLQTQLSEAKEEHAENIASQLTAIDDQIVAVQASIDYTEQYIIDHPTDPDAPLLLNQLNQIKADLVSQRETLVGNSGNVSTLEQQVALKETEVENKEANKLFQKQYFITVEGGDLAELNGSITILLNSSNDITDATGGIISGTLPTGVNENRISIDNIDPILALTSNADNDELTETEIQAGITLTGSVSEASLFDEIYYFHKNDTGSVEVNDGVWNLMLNETTLNSIEESGSVSITFKAFDLVGNSSEELTRTMTLNRAPVVSNITFSGVPEVDSVLTVTYDYSDKEGENEQGSEYRWYTSSDTTVVQTIIQGETSTSYTFKSDDEGNYIQFVVIPNDGTVIGDSLASKWIGPVTLPKPEMVVKGSGVEIVHNAAISSISDSTNFGVVAVTDAIVSSVYRVFNIGDAPLLLGNSAVTITGVNNSDFEITAQPNSIVPAGDSTKFIVAFNPLDSGNREAQINISSNDADESPYSFSVSGTGNAAPSIAGTLANQVVNENEIIAPFSTVVFEDNEADDISITVKLDDNFKGSLNSLEFTGVGPYSLVATSISNAQEAIRGITFNPTDNRVLTGETETTRFIITISDALTEVSDTLTTVISTAINEAPITSVTETPVMFTEGGEAVKVDASISISDTDNSSLKTATVSISNGFEVDEDSLGFINDGSTMGNILGSYNKVTGVLTLVSDGATATNEEFERALRSIFYMNLSTAPKTHDRTINFSVNDGLASSNEGSKILKISSVNNVPVATNLQVTGSDFAGENLTGSYTFTDADSDVENGSLYKWYSADDATGTNSVLLDTAEDIIYTLKEEDEGKYLQFVVFPKDGIAFGDSVKSSWIGPVVLPLADILVQGNGVNIEHGSVTASANDSTNFGSISITQESIIRNYTIKSTGTDTLTFSRNAISIIGESADEFVVIDGPSGWIQDGDSTTFSIKFDPSVSGVRKATIRIANNVAGKNPYTFVIEGIGLNTAPVFTSLDTVDIKENTQIATTLTANDEETPESLIYSLVAENGDGSLFSIDNESGELTFESIPNFETPLDADEDNIYEITVSVSDGDKEALQQLKIVVSDENEFAPVVTSTSKVSVYETDTSGTIITTITATDEDATSSLKYSLITNSQDIFELGELSGELKLKDASKLNKKATPILLVELMVTDGDSSTYQELEVDVLTIPTVVGVSPKADEVSVELDRDIIIKYDQSLQEGSLSEIKITSEGDQTVSNVAANVKDSTIVINHDKFMNDTKYVVSIGEGAVLNLDNAGNKVFQWSFTTKKEAPEKVILVGPLNNKGSVVLNTDFDWEESDRASSYNFQLSKDSLFTENIISESNINAPSLTLSTDLEFYQNYYWRVRGINEDGKGEWSQVAHFVTIAKSPTQVFPISGATSISTAPTIQWSSDYEQSTFQIELTTTNSSDSFKVDTTVTRAEFLIKGLKANTEYSWKVRVSDAATSSVWSEESIFTTRPDPEEETEEPINVNITFGGTSGGSTDPDGGTVAKSDKIEVTDYRMVGLPGTDNIRLDDFFTGKYKRDWRAFIETGNPTEFYNEYAPEDNRFIFKPGLGFWVLSTKIVADTYDFSPVKVNDNDAYGISVHPGWNIIANPYRSDVEWKLVQEMNNLTAEIYDYKQQFIETDTLKVLGGYYFYNDPQLDIDTLFIPYTGFDQRGLKKDTTDRSKGIPNLLIEAKDDKNHLAEVKVYYPAIKGKVVNKKFLTSYHPNIEQVQFGMVLKDDELRNRLKTTSSYFDNEGQKYELELKGERGTNLNWNVEFDQLPENAAALLINKITQETYLLDKSMTFSTLISESHSKYDLYVGDLDRLKEKQESLIPQEFELQPNYPNPFNPSTTINFSLPKEAKVSLIVYDILGRKVATLVNGKQKAGWHKIYFDGSNLASGVYLYRLVVDKQQKLGRMTLIK